MSKQKPIKVLFVLPSLKAGGAERVMSTIAKGLDKNKFKSILVVAGKKEDAVYPTDNLEVIFLNKTRILKAIPSLFWLILTKQPNIVVGSISHVNRVLAAKSVLFPNIKFIGREASVGSVMKQYYSEPDNRLGITVPFLRDYHKKLDAIICQSQDMASDFTKTYNVSKDKLHIVNNPASDSLNLKNITKKNSVKQLITIGRLSKEKGHERLLYVLEKLQIPYQYTIIGNGNEKESIFELADNLNLTDKISYIPFTSEIEKQLAKSDLFIQGSYVEGFPNALLESCIVGTPVIAFNAPGGTKEIIENDVNGYLVNSAEEFQDKLEYSLMKKEWNPKLIRESVMKKFNSEDIISKYETIFTNLINKN